MTVEMEVAVSELGDRGNAAACGAAAEYFRVHGVKVDDVDAASKAICKHVREAIPEALKDAADAAECGMVAWGIATYLASMRLAGIKAAKEIAGHK